MNINPKDRRNYHRLTVEEKRVLFSSIHDSVRKFQPKYIRMFTEPRAKGYRCKLWGGNLNINQLEKMSDAIYTDLKNTKFGNAIFAVEGYYGHCSPCFYVKFN